MNGLFITGTDTGVGKTVVTAGIARCLRARGVRVGVCKPVATGAEWQEGRLVSQDTIQLARAAGAEDKLERVTPWVFPEAAAPPVAAAKHGIALSLEAMAEAIRWWESRADVVLVEGVGGLLCPLTERETVADLAASMAFPIIVVARTGLGTLNHTLMTVEVAERRRLAVRGVILNQSGPPDGSLAERTNVDQLRQRLRVPILATVQHQSGDEEIAKELAGIDWPAFLECGL